MTKNKTITLSAPVAITAAASDEAKRGPRRFDVLAYTGGALRLNGWDLPVVVDLSQLEQGKSLVANLDHESSKRVGHVDGVTNDHKQLHLSGAASASTPYRDEVVNSADDGFVWQASIEADVLKAQKVASGKSVNVNGQTHQGPVYVVKGRLKGFGFVSHGADDNTTVTIAAGAASSKGNDMDKDLKKWIEAMGFNADDLSEQQIAGLKANYEGRNAPPTKHAPDGDGLDALLASQKQERQRVEAITRMTGEVLAEHPHSTDTIEAMARLAIEGKWDTQKFELELLRATRPQSHTVFASRRDDRLTNRVLEAAVCMSGKLADVEERFDDQTLQAAHDKFKGGIGLKQLILLAAQANGYHANYASDITLDVQRAAFGMEGPRQVRATAGFSTVSLANIISNVANKFLMEGWDAVDNTCMRLARVRPVNDFKQITTASLTGGLVFEKVGASGELNHGSLGDMAYTNKADTYGIITAITRTDYINDDLGALTAVPKRIGRGGALKRNDLFWTKFLNNLSFFTTARGNYDEGADTALSLEGLELAEQLFLAQTDPDGKPLGAEPAILLVPTAKKATATTLMTSEKIVTGENATKTDDNIWKGRFRVESSPYMSNSAFTGYSTKKWYLLADPNDLPVIEIVALKGRVEPIVETADADFNVLGIQMRGYSDIGMELQEYRGGVAMKGEA